MCGIFGYAGSEPCLHIITAGLRKLEYRGYDSAGVMLYDNAIQVVKTAGKVADILPRTSELSPRATIGMGHTRWASHGKATVANAHPHHTPAVAIVHNGIIENHAELRATLSTANVNFQSETDTEVVLHLVAHALQDQPDPLAAFSAVMRQLKGLYGLAMFFACDPQRIYLSRKGLPLAIAASENAHLFSSDPLALAEYSSNFIFPADAEIIVLERERVAIYDYDGKQKTLPLTQHLQVQTQKIDKGSYRHFMLKEIHEQGLVLGNIIHRLFDFAQLRPRSEMLALPQIDMQQVKRIKIVGCGTSYHAAMLAAHFSEEQLHIESVAEVAHELRYRRAMLDAQTLVVALSQSGETADTLSCIEHARSRGCQTLAICNNPHSTLARTCDALIELNCGPEIGVASTKAFTATVLIWYLYVLAVRSQRSQLPTKDIYNLRKMPLLIDYVLNNAAQLASIARRYRKARNFIYIGRGPSFPIALESALKLKEISYIHAEGYAGGELKHGPIALIDRNMPVLVVAPQDEYFPRIVSNAGEVKAREGQIIVLGNPKNRELRALGDEIISCPDIDHPLLQAIVSAVPLQLFAYYLALEKGTDIDQPRHLAKSVTVE